MDPRYIYAKILACDTEIVSQLDYLPDLHYYIYLAYSIQCPDGIDVAKIMLQNRPWLFDYLSYKDRIDYFSETLEEYWIDSIPKNRYILS